MKRYDFEDTGLPGYPEYMMLENEDGEWVKYEDAQIAIEVSFNYGKGDARHQPPPMCNCQKEFEQPTGIKNGNTVYYNMWICPKHGFKKW